MGREFNFLAWSNYFGCRNIFVFGYLFVVKLGVLLGFSLEIFVVYSSCYLERMFNFVSWI